jgi:hypothetical protein
MEGLREGCEGLLASEDTSRPPAGNVLMLPQALLPLALIGD